MKEYKLIYYATFEYMEDIEKEMNQAAKENFKYIAIIPAHEIFVLEDGKETRKYRSPIIIMEREV